VDLTAQNNLSFGGGTSYGYLGGGSVTVNFSGAVFSRASLTHYGAAGGLAVNARVAADTDKVAAAGAGAGGLPASGDGQTARLLGDLATQPIFENIRETPAGALGRLVQTLGGKGRDAQILEKASGAILQQLERQRQSEVGVNVDEEMVQMLQYQRGFEAAARFLTTVDGLLDTLINRVGLAGR
jgi:flagellar hook-associated protein 1 FlgK